MCRITNVYMAAHWCWCDTQICVCGLVHTPNYSKRGAVLQQDPHASCSHKPKRQASPWDVLTHHCIPWLQAAGYRTHEAVDADNEDTRRGGIAL